MRNWLYLLIPTLGLTAACSKAGSNAKQKTASQIKTDRYRFFAPDSASAELRPLLVMLHGCDQDAEAFEAGTEMDAQAQRDDFFVLYPNQVKGRNLANCWRWFDPANRRPESGELAEIMKMIEEVAQNFPIDPSRVFVSGISSGSATASALLACYPDRFQGAAFHSGPALNVADNEYAAMAAMKFGPSKWFNPWASNTCEPAKTQKRLLVIQGKSDSVVNPSHAPKLIEQFLPEGANAEPYRLSLSKMGEKPVEVEGYRVHESEAFLVKVNGMKHAWAGGGEGKYFDPEAFSASELISRYLVKGQMTFERSH